MHDTVYVMLRSAKGDQVRENSSPRYSNAASFFKNMNYHV